MNADRVVKLFLVAALCALFMMTACDNDGDGGTATTIFDQLEVDRTLKFPQLGGRVEVVKDEFGVPHIVSVDDNPDDIVFVQGYVMASDRFWEMDLIRKFAGGKITELLGLLDPSILADDLYYRTIFTTVRGNRLHQEIVDLLRDEVPELYDNILHFTAGINAFLADLRAGRNGATLPTEYRVLLMSADRISDWEQVDSFVLGAYQQWSLSSSLGSELARQFRWESLAAAEDEARIPLGCLADSLQRSAPIEDVYIVPGFYDARRGGERGPAASPAYRRLPADFDIDLLRQMVDTYRRIDRNSASFQPDIGSNNWVVGPGLSATGNPILANDPHLSLINPSIFYETHLDNETFSGGGSQVAGLTFPGVPGVIIGHTKNLAWGVTNVGYDVTDVYMEEVTTPEDYPESPRTVLFKGEQIPVITVEEHFCIRGEESVWLPIEVVPHHGPQLPDPDPFDGVTGLPSVNNMSFRWAGHEPSREMITLDRLAKVRTMEEFFAALNYWEVGAQNYIGADVDGNIAYYPHARVPIREEGARNGYPPYLPMPGTGGYEWMTDPESGALVFLPNDEIPQALNPEEGFIVTANNDLVGNTDDNDPLNDAHYLYFSPAYGVRASRIRTLIDEAADGGVEFDEMKTMQFDNYSLLAERYLVFLMAALDEEIGRDPDARLLEVRQRLAAWDLTHPTGTDIAGFRDAPPDQAEIETSAAAMIFNAWLVRFLRNTLEDEYGEAGLGSYFSAYSAIKTLLHLLEDVNEDQEDPRYKVHTLGPNEESLLFDDIDTPELEGSHEIIIASMVEALDFLEEHLGSTFMDDWRWGRLHRITFISELFHSAGLKWFDLPSTTLADGCYGYPATGGFSTVNPASPSGRIDQFTYGHGPSLRMVTELDPAGLRCDVVIPGGQGGIASIPAEINEESHYGDQIPLWMTGRYHALHFDLNDVVDNAASRMVFTKGTD